MRNMIATALLAIAAFALTACGNDATSSTLQPPTAVAPAPASTTATPKTTAQKQVEKFDYLTSPAHTVPFEQRQPQKRLLVQAMLDGRFGKPVILQEGSVFTASVNAPDGHSLFAILDNVNGKPDTSNPYSVDISKNGQQLVALMNSVHDWPTSINGQSVFLRFSASVGDLNTCLWPVMSAEVELCNGTYGTEDAAQLMKLDTDAMAAFDRESHLLLGN